VRFGGLQKFSLSDYPGKVAAVVFTRGCNFRCPYCHNPDLVRGGDPENVDTLDEQQILSFLEQRRGRLQALVITGGEPTLHDDLPDFIARVKRIGYAVKLDTNGSRPEVLESLLQAHLIDFVAMDVKAPPDKYECLAGKRVDLPALRRSIDIAINSGVAHEFRTTAVKPMLCSEDIMCIGEMLRGAMRYTLQPFVPSRTLDPALPDRALPFSREELESVGHRLARTELPCHVR